MHVKYKLVGRDGKMLGPQREATGTTSFFVGAGGINETNAILSRTILADVTTDERQALPLAAEELATRLVSELSEGW
jgi:hypothetical protein